jgi:glycosyltransferase involved in cell wall biosynthesis
MKVIWLAPHPIPNRSSSHPAPWITSLAGLLAKKGVNLTIVTTGRDIEKDFEIFQLNSYQLIVVKTPKHRWDLLSFYRLKIKKIQDVLGKIYRDYDLIHVHGTEHQLFSAVDRFTIPKLISIQGFIFKSKRYLPKRLSVIYLSWAIGSYFEKEEIKRCRYFLCRTSWDQATVRELNPNATIFKIWEIIREEFYHHKVSADGSDILFSGGENSIKGLTRALIVFNRLLKTLPGKLHVLGNCSWKFIEDTGKKYALHGLNTTNVILHGMVEAREIIDISKNCFCLYHPSLIDNSPNSVCEAQLIGLPVVATRVGGVASLITHQVSGILLDDHPENDLVQILKLKSDRALRQELANNAYDVSHIRHNRNEIVDKLLFSYQEVYNAESTKSHL